MKNIQIEYIRLHYFGAIESTPFLLSVEYLWYLNPGLGTLYVCLQYVRVHF